MGISQHGHSSLPVPPDALRFRVSNSRDVKEFLDVGERCANDLRTAINTIGRDIADCQAVLDFGCGSGRTLRWFVEKQPGFHGSDIDAEAIEWCKANLQGMTFSVNDSLPPLSIREPKFDLVYAISVFSHLNETYTRAWLAELRRVTLPGGIVAISICGPLIYRATGMDVGDLHRNGLIFKQSDFWKDHFPAWYGDMYYDEIGARRIFSQDLDLVSYVPLGVNKHQDLLLLRKPP